MVVAAQTMLIPVSELPPGEILRIRNSVISQVVALAASELSMKEEDLVVRDIDPYTDLGWDWAAATNGTAHSWVHSATGNDAGYHTFNGDTTMADQRYVAIFGVRDARWNIGSTQGATDSSSYYKPCQPASAIKFSVGGSTKAIWDIMCLNAYINNAVAVTPAAIIIPQNVIFNIYHQVKTWVSATGRQTDIDMNLQLIGVVVEPRGKVISP